MSLKTEIKPTDNYRRDVIKFCQDLDIFVVVELNKVDSKFCAICRMVLTYDAYEEIIEEKQRNESEVSTLARLCQ